MRDDRYLNEAEGRRRALQRCLRLLSQYTNGPPGHLLDVGCSAGIFLTLASEAGWSVFGVEPSDWLSARARSRFGARVLSTSFEKAAFRRQSFDAITFWDVLEHLADPVGSVNKAAHLVRPGGVLALNVPNIESAIARLMGYRWPLLLPEHIFYFSRRALQMLLEQHGFAPLGFHLHPVFFNVGYVLDRPAQHDVPGVGPIGKILRTMGLQDRSIPLLVGELIAVGRRRSPE